MPLRPVVNDQVKGAMALPLGSFAPVTVAVCTVDAASAAVGVKVRVRVGRVVADAAGHRAGPCGEGQLRGAGLDGFAERRGDSGAARDARGVAGGLLPVTVGAVVSFTVVSNTTSTQ